MTTTRQIGCELCPTDGDVKQIRALGGVHTYCAACYMRLALRQGMSRGDAAVVWTYAP